jgi:hypothetical protein
MDSNFQYAGTVNLVVASLCRSIAWDGSARRSGVTAIAGSGREFWHDVNLRVQQDARIAPGCCRAEQVQAHRPCWGRDVGALSFGHFP